MAALAVFTIVSRGASTGTLTVLEQFVPPGQVGSPPPDTVAVLVRVWPLAAAVGVTGMVKLTGVPVARPTAMLQLIAWPVAVQPAGSGVPITRSPGIVSLTEAMAVVAAVPVLVTVSV